MGNDKLIININLETDYSDTTSLINGINSLSPPAPKRVVQEEEVILFTDISKKKKDKKATKNKKKKKSDSILSGAFGIDDTDDTNIDDINVIDSDTLLDIDEILREKEEDSNNEIIDEQKGNYKKLKKQDNEYKKEFAEELTLLYTLLDETSKFSKNVEKKYAELDNQKVRGVSKYTNDLAQIVLNSKQSKLSILNGITSLKKTIADLKIKADGKDKGAISNEKNPEHLASAYFKTVLNHGRTDFIKRMAEDDDYDNPEAFASSVSHRKSKGLGGLTVQDEESFFDELEKRLQDSGGYRSAEGSKYIEYENRGVKILVRKCIDTGEWSFIAIDKNNEVVDDYPLPTKREAGRMKFNADGTYATDEKGRMYKVLEYFTDVDEEDDDDDDMDEYDTEE